MFPGRHNILRFEQVEQMALGRQNVAVARTDGGTYVFCLAGFLSDDNLISHGGLISEIECDNVLNRTYREQLRLASCLLAA